MKNKSYTKSLSVGGDNHHRVDHVFYLSKLVRRITDFQIEIASEVIVNRARMYNPAKLKEIREHLDRPDYPWKVERENKIFWNIYHELVREPCNGKGNGDARHYSAG